MYSKRIRVFAGIAVPPLVGLVHWFDGLDEKIKVNAALRWVPIPNWHITLRYIGMVDGDRIPGLLGSLADAVADSAPFGIAVKGIGAFPSFDKPKVIWAGVGDNGLLGALQQKVSNTLVGFGFCEEAELFVPHITLAQCKAAPDLNQFYTMGSLYGNSFFGKIDVKDLVLFLSESTPNGMVYSPIGRIGLLGGTFD